MPELPEVETLVRQLSRRLSGLTVERAEFRCEAILREPRAPLTAALKGRLIRQVFRRGKYLGFRLENAVLWFHLGMTGQLMMVDGAESQDPHLHCVLHFQDQRSVLLFRDIRKFGRIFISRGDTMPESVSRLGPDPLEIGEDVFCGIFRNRAGRIKPLLLDQHLLAGVGNIYADESLFRAGIDPRRRPVRISAVRFASLLGALKSTLREAIRHGGSSIDDYRHADGARGNFQDYHRVYGREGKSCLQCGTRIRRVTLAGRSSFFCNQCQK